MQMAATSVTAITKTGTSGLQRGTVGTSRTPPATKPDMQTSQADAGEVPFSCTSHPLGYDYRSRFGSCEVLRWFAGGTLFLARNHEGFVIIADESTLANRLGIAEMPEPISVYLFRSDYERMTYALRRGWWNVYRSAGTA